MVPTMPIRAAAVLRAGIDPDRTALGKVKTRGLANVCVADLAALRPPLRAGLARVRRQPQLAFAFLRHAGLAF